MGKIDIDWAEVLGPSSPERFPPASPIPSQNPNLSLSDRRRPPILAAMGKIDIDWAEVLGPSSPERFPLASPIPNQNPNLSLSDRRRPPILAAMGKIDLDWAEVFGSSSPERFPLASPIPNQNPNLSLSDRRRPPILAAMGKIDIDWAEALGPSSPERRDVYFAASPSAAPARAAAAAAAKGKGEGEFAGMSNDDLRREIARSRSLRPEFEGFLGDGGKDNHSRRAALEAEARRRGLDTAAKAGDDCKRIARYAAKNVCIFEIEDEQGEYAARKCCLKSSPVCSTKKNYGQLGITKRRSLRQVGRRKPISVDKMYSSKPCSTTLSGHQHRIHAIDPEEAGNENNNCSYSTKRRKAEHQDSSLLYFQKMPGPTEPERWDYHTHGEIPCPCGGYTEVLHQLLQHLRYRQRPIYRGRKTGEGDQEAWTGEVFLYARKGEFEPRTFRTEHQRSTSTSAVQDAARQAIVRLCDIHSDLVQDSEYVEALREITELQQALATSEADAEALRSQLDEQEAALATTECERAAAVSEFARATAVTPAAVAAVAATGPITTPAGGSTSILRLRTTVRKHVRAPVSIVVADSSPSRSRSRTLPARRGSGGLHQRVY